MSRSQAIVFGSNAQFGLGPIGRIDVAKSMVMSFPFSPVTEKTITGEMLKKDPGITVGGGTTSRALVGTKTEF